MNLHRRIALTLDAVVRCDGTHPGYGFTEEGRADLVSSLDALFMGAARVPEVGPEHLTFTAAEAVEAAGAFPEAVIVPLHYEGWAHFSESRREVEEAITAAGLNQRLRWPEPGRAMVFAT